ncbi:exopolyphosphatase [Sulfuriferula thiophila]|uniref:exopolyphosphatase n=1 Tax=Sulfuriferula thiophila TaxID=1781211 RepID=UPI000F610BA0|nr:exopolyphosphatase [Sulfuriferula thiophila]
MNEYTTLAAVDLGSNSFKLQVARVVDDQIYPLDTLKEPVRLTAGIGDDKKLDRASQERGLACLNRFSERLRGLPQGAVRCVGTSALRVAENSAEFLQQAEAILGYPIEIIAGREEARLVYIGVAHSLPAAEHPRLIIDIGGGSTECVIGEGMTPQLMESLHLGCVSFTQRFFADGQINKTNLAQAILVARAEAQTIATSYAGKWQEAVGSSGTARVISDVLVLNGWADQGITREGLELLREHMIMIGNQGKLDLPGMKADRKPVFAGGVAVMSGIFAEFGIEKMTITDGALREGVLYDLLGRFHHRDMRAATVSQFMRRYHVDHKQARRVADIATQLFKQIEHELSAAHELKPYLLWAAQLHEIGISIAHSGYHKHGAYILAHADMPGFSQKDQARIALLVRTQRGGLDKLGDTTQIPATLQPMVFILRLAVLFCRSRSPIDLGQFTLSFGPNAAQLQLSEDWLAANPLTTTALSDESRAWKQVGYKFTINAVS